MQTPDTFHDYAALVDTAIALNRRHRAQFALFREGCDAPTFARMLCTVRLDIGRRSGKSRYLSERAGADALVVVATPAHARQANEAAPPCAVIAAQDVAAWAAAHPKPATVYVEEPLFVFAELGEDAFYGDLADADREQTFVLLGA